MSIPVPLEGLRAATEERGGRAYVLTVSDDGRPHAVHGRVDWDADVLAVEVGRRTAANASARPLVSLLYPPGTDGDYSLIVDGTGAVTRAGDTQRLVVTPTKAILHRSAPAPDPTQSCAHDCVTILPAHDDGRR